MASEDNWEPAKASPDQCVWVTVPGTDVNLQLLHGWPSTIMAAVAADFNAYIEPLRDPDSAGWTPTNSVPTSNHLNGTAMDLNWDSHKFQTRGTFNPGQVDTIRALLDFYEGTIFWAGDWDDPIDEMHWQMGYTSYDNPHTGDVIHRKIRADGFSTFRRGDAPPPLSRTDRYALAVINEGQKRNISRKGIQIALTVPPVESGWRILANENIPESLTLPHDGVGGDHDSVGAFQQRQAWGPLRCTMDIACSAGLFYDGGADGQRGLTDFDYDAHYQSPGQFAADVQQPAAQYRGRYDEHWDDAVALYDRLATPAPPPPPPPPPPEDDFMSELSALEQRNLYDALMTQRPSRSPLRHLNEGTVGDAPDQVWDIDGNVHLLVVKALAMLGDPESLALLQEVAAADPALYPDRQKDRLLAQAILHDSMSASAPQAPAPAAPPAPFAPVDSPPPVAPSLPPLTSVTLTAAPVASPGQLIGQMYDALAALRLHATLPAEVAAPLDALIGVLKSYPKEQS